MAGGGPKPWSTFGRVVSVTESTVTVYLETTSDLKAGDNVLLVVMPPSEHSGGAGNEQGDS